MAAALCQSLPAAADLFRRASAILGYDLLDVCTNGPAEKLSATDVSQPAIFVASIAALEQLKVTEPDAVADVVATAGLSLGEYTALAFAGALSFEDGVKLVQARGRAMQDAADATPLRDGQRAGNRGAAGRGAGDRGTRERHARMSRTCSAPATPLSPVRSPHLTGSSKLCVQKGGIRTVRLTVAGAFHTSLMKPADEKLAWRSRM